ncbi:MAG: hypothetical protein A2Z20_00410 [Bdellovibrionales bacterium RBG_16_40_8]|nr:MAG: hypothetical protein A2Z20_00410 [Bdellovibrionales bacterium RBG_16_40_8]
MKSLITAEENKNISTKLIEQKPRALKENEVLIYNDARIKKGDFVLITGGGLAESAELQTTVMPLVLRGVSLLGISSNNCPRQTNDRIVVEI